LCSANAAASPAGPEPTTAMLCLPILQCSKKFERTANGSKCKLVNRERGEVKDPNVGSLEYLI
jgi:hypothetical protein